MDFVLEGVVHIRSSMHMFRMTEAKRAGRPRDPNQLAKLITDIATGQADDPVVTEDGRDLAAVLLGRRGGLKGGKARAQALSPERRREIAVKAAQSRWKRSAGGEDGET